MYVMIMISVDTINVSFLAKLEKKQFPPPHPQQVGSQGEKTCLRILRLRRFFQTLWLDRKIVRLPPKKGFCLAV